MDDIHGSAGGRVTNSGTGSGAKSPDAGADSYPTPLWRVLSAWLAEEIARGPHGEAVMQVGAPGRLAESLDHHGWTLFSRGIPSESNDYRVRNGLIPGLAGAQASFRALWDWQAVIEKALGREPALPEVNFRGRRADFSIRERLSRLEGILGREKEGGYTVESLIDGLTKRQGESEEVFKSRLDMHFDRIEALRKQIPPLNAVADDIAANTANIRDHEQQMGTLARDVVQAFNKGVAAERLALRADEAIESIYTMLTKPGDGFLADRIREALAHFYGPEEEVAANTSAPPPPGRFPFPPFGRRSGEDRRFNPFERRTGTQIFDRRQCPRRREQDTGGGSQR